MYGLYSRFELSFELVQMTLQAFWEHLREAGGVASAVAEDLHAQLAGLIGQLRAQTLLSQELLAVYSGIVCTVSSIIVVLSELSMTAVCRTVHVQCL